MIRIGRPILSERDGHSRVTADIVVDGRCCPLWAEVEGKYAAGLCSDRSDAFVIGLLGFAIRFGHDIEFEAPMTDLLKDQLENDFIDVLCQHEPRLHRVRLTGPVTRPIPKVRTVRGMGLSCGIDCLYTVRRRMSDASLGERYFLMTDAHFQGPKSTPEGVARSFGALYETGREFADEMGVPLIVIRSNWGAALPGLTIYDNATYCNAFCALMLQNLLTHYYIAASGPIDEFARFYFKRGALGTDCSDFDLLSLQAYSSPSLRFIADGMVNRIDKVRSLLDWPPCWKYLDVCGKHGRATRGNDTNDCEKCMRTVCEIVAVGGLAALDRFERVFDVAYVRSHRAEYLAYLICHRLKRSEYSMEMWCARAREGCGFGEYLKAAFIIVRKAVRKVFRDPKPPRSWADI